MYGLNSVSTSAVLFAVCTSDDHVEKNKNA
eukprot:COSAG03_NODE_26548_length_258_cov_1.031447_1_plen_29_part_01